MAALIFYFRSGRPPFFSLELWGDLWPPFYTATAAAAGRSVLLFAELALFATICSLAGRAVLFRVFRISTLNSLETFSFSFLIGAGVLAYATAGLAFLGHLSKGAVGAATAAAALAGIVWGRRVPSSALAEPDKSLRRWRKTLLKGWNIWPAMLVAAMFSLYGFYALAPEVFYDSLVYHLALPELFKAAGRWVATPTNLYSGVPMTMEMLFLWGSYWGGEGLAKLIPWGFGVGLGAGILGLALRRHRPFAGWMACAVYFSTPLFGLNVFRTAVDVGSAFAVFLAVCALALGAHETEEGRPEEAKSFWPLSGLCLGLAMGMKYTNWPALPVLLIVGWIGRAPRRGLFWFAVCALACAVPWVVKNVVCYGNPLFPYFNEFFNPHALYPVDWRGLSADAWSRDWGNILHNGKALFRTLAHPWVITMEGLTDADDVGPLFLMGLPAVLAARGGARSTRVWILALAGLWLAWWPLTAMPRFFLPGLALGAVWIVFSIGEFASPAARRLVWIGVAGLALHNLSSTAVIARQFGAWDCVLGRESREDYLSASHGTYPMPDYRSARWIARETPADARVLVVGDGRSYRVERFCFASSVWDTDLFTAWLKASSSEEEFRGKLASEGVRYLLVNTGEAMRRKMGGLTAEEASRLDRFFRFFARETFRDVETDPRRYRWSQVYEVLDRRLDAEGPPAPLAMYYAHKASGAGP